MKTQVTNFLMLHLIICCTSQNDMQFEYYNKNYSGSYSYNEWPYYIPENFPVNALSGFQLADINKDDKMDVINGNFWIEAPGDPKYLAWQFHRFCKWEDMGEKYFRGMNYHVVTDFTDDGFLDIIVIETGIPVTRINLFVRSLNDGTGFLKVHPQEADTDVGIEEAVAFNFSNLAYRNKQPIRWGLLEEKVIVLFI